MTETLLTVEDLALLLRTTPAGIHAMRYRGDGPPAIKIARKVLFRPEAVEEWLADRTEQRPAALDPAAAARALSCTVKDVRQLVADGKLKPIPLGHGRIRISREQLDALLNGEKLDTLQNGDTARRAVPGGGR